MDRGIGPPKFAPVRVRRAAVDELIGHAREALPDECCGLLVGSPDAIRWTVRSRNLAASPARYLIDPEVQFAAMRSARAAGLTVAGAYHSHPATAAVPSAADLAEAGDPEFLYVIVSPAAGSGEADVRGYRMAEGNFHPVELVVD
ncbi:MAG: M67 family metallopeptidase [Acidobacteria bacterium]|nr:M67 family metallopeptidase [Acidobacteriota bacterium]